MMYLQKLSRGIDYLNDVVGQSVSWLVFFLVLLVSYDVVMRYFFNSGAIALQELAWHIFATIFLLTAGFTLKQDQHVRLDLLYRSSYMTPYRRAISDFLGAVFFLLPFCLLVIISSIPFVYQSYSYAEHSPDPGGLPYRWIMKGMIQVGFFLLLLQGISNAIKDLIIIIKHH